MTYKLSNFYRTKGATDEKERKKRNVKGYVTGAFGVASASALGNDTIRNTAGEQVGKLKDMYDKIQNKKGKAFTLLGGGIATGLATKAYLNHKKNKRNQERYDNSLEGKVNKIKSKIKENTKGSFNTLFPKYE